jgi:hypothetical protein
MPFLDQRRIAKNYTPAEMSVQGKTAAFFATREEYSHFTKSICAEA